MRDPDPSLRSSRSLYTGVTNNLRRRLDEHNQKRCPGFTARYHINRLVYFSISRSSKMYVMRSIVRRKSKSQTLDSSKTSRVSRVQKPQVGRFESRLGSAPDISPRSRRNHKSSRARTQIPRSARDDSTLMSGRRSFNRAQRTSHSVTACIWLRTEL
jgi:predicted GIY-YIG superfamily endonuclease